MNSKLLSELCFGSRIRPVSIPELAKETGYCEKSLYNWKECPERMSIGKVCVIAKAIGIKPEELAEVFR